MINGLRYATAQGHDLSKMSDLDIDTGITKGIYEFEHMTPDELVRAVRDARRLIGNRTATADPMQQLRQAIASANFGTKFAVQPLPQSGQGCRERFVVQHGYANGVPISATEVAITYDGRVVAMHPKFRWDDDPPSRGQERRSVCELLESIFGADNDYADYRSSRPRRRLV
jgi:hypothetical protein